MSSLLETLRADTNSKFCWSGRLVMPGPPRPPIADPVVLTRQGHSSIVLVAGALSQRAMLKAASLVKGEALRPETRLVYLVLAVQGGRLGALSSAGAELREAGRHAAIIAYLQEVAFGPALWLAFQCGLVFAAAATQIGWLECFSEEGEFDSDATLAMIDDLVELNPQVARSTWARLIQASMNGEAAEAAGIIGDGALKRDVFELSGLDPNGELAR